MFNLYFDVLEDLVLILFLTIESLILNPLINVKCASSTSRFSIKISKNIFPFSFKSKLFLIKFVVFIIASAILSSILHISKESS